MIAKTKVLASWRETPTIHAVRVAKPERFDFAPVQFVGLEIPVAGGSEEYPMSIASSPTRPHVEFGARVSSGSAWKRAFAALKEGDEAEIDGPYGHFVLDEERDAVLVAGGIGITPLKGMLEYATDKRLGIEVVLLYSNRTPEEIAFREHLEGLAKQNRRARVVHTLTRPPARDGWEGRTGRVDEALLREASDGLDEPAFYVCGTPGMVADMVKTLRQRMRVPADRVLWEQFSGY